METSARHVRLARRLARAAVGLAVLLAVAAVLWLSGLAGDPERRLATPTPEGHALPAAGPEALPALPPLGAEILPVLPKQAPPPPPARGGGLAPYPAGRDLDYLSPESLPPAAPRSSEAGDMDT